MSSSAVDWDVLWKRGGFNRWPSEELVRWASTLEPGSKVLEVGCGAGANLQALSGFGLDAWGVDLSTEAVEASASVLNGLGTVLAPVSAIELTFDDQEFDAVCDVQCFQHLEQQELALAYSEAARVLKPGGRFFELFLIKGQAYFPDLPFCEFTSTPIKMAGFKLGPDHFGYYERRYRRRDGYRRCYRYVLIDSVLDSPSTLTRQGKLCSGE